MISLCRSGYFMQFFAKNLETSPQPSMKWGKLVNDFPVQSWTFHLIPKKKLRSFLENQSHPTKGIWGLIVTFTIMIFCADLHISYNS